MSTEHLNEFSTVRALCTACGWFRVLGFCGQKDDVRAVIRIDADAAESNLLRGRVLELPSSARPDEWPEGYRDLSDESYRCGTLAIERTFDPLLKDKSCPRCRKAGALGVNWYTMIGGDPLLASMWT
jgi:hypothetical protein